MSPLLLAQENMVSTVPTWVAVLILIVLAFVLIWIGRATLNERTSFDDPPKDPPPTPSRRIQLPPKRDKDTR